KHAGVPADAIRDGGTSVAVLFCDRPILDRARVLRCAWNLAGLARRTRGRRELRDSPVLDLELSRPLAGGHGVGDDLDGRAGSLSTLRVAAEARDARREWPRGERELCRGASQPPTTRSSARAGRQGLDAVGDLDRCARHLGYPLDQGARAQPGRLLGLEDPMAPSAG